MTYRKGDILCHIGNVTLILIEKKVKNNYLCEWRGFGLSCHESELKNYVKIGRL